MAKKDETPTCVACTGKNWVDLGIIALHQDTNLPDDQREVHLYQCGGGRAFTPPEDIKNGCMRLIRAVPADMKRGGMI